MQAAANARAITSSDTKATRASVSIESTARATRVLGRKVIDSSTAVILGFVDELYFHLETQQIVAIRVRAGFKARLLGRLKGRRSRWVVPIHLVHSIGAYAVVVDREQAAISTSPSTPGKAEKKPKPPHKPPAGATTLHTLLGQVVVTDAGELLGKLLDVLLNDAGSGMQQFEIDTRKVLGPRSKRRLISARTRALGDVLLVPADLRQATPLFARTALAAPAAVPDQPVLEAIALAAPAAEPEQAVPEAMPLATPEWLC